MSKQILMLNKLCSATPVTKFTILSEELSVFIPGGRPSGGPPIGAKKNSSDSQKSFEYFVVKQYCQAGI
jgi:hypothetical protein